jgi:hypothetical protein
MEEQSAIIKYLEDRHNFSEKYAKIIAEEYLYIGLYHLHKPTIDIYVKQWLKIKQLEERLDKIESFLVL